MNISERIVKQELDKIKRQEAVRLFRKSLKSTAEHVTIDEWTDKHPLFRDNVEVMIEHLTDLRGEDAYKLRRMIMTFARQEFDS